MCIKTLYNGLSYGNGFLSATTTRNAKKKKKKKIFVGPEKAKRPRCQVTVSDRWYSKSTIAFYFQSSTGFQKQLRK